LVVAIFAVIYMFKLLYNYIKFSDLTFVKVGGSSCTYFYNMQTSLPVRFEGLNGSVVVTFIHVVMLFKCIWYHEKTLLKAFHVLLDEHLSCFVALLDLKFKDKKWLSTL
jgi:hypothetical protein